MKRLFSAQLWSVSLLMLAAVALVVAITSSGISAGPENNSAPPKGEPIFVSWPTPKLALVFTGLQDGYIEPCGCSGKENQKGGLSRRDMLLHQLANDKWPFVAMDLGDQVRRYGRQQEVKFQATADALKAIGYQAVGFGPDDLRLSASELLAPVSSVGTQQTPFVSANVGLYAFDDKLIPRFKIIEASGMKIGVTSVLGDSYRSRVNNADIQFLPAAEALSAVLPKLEAARCNPLVLLSNATVAESKELAKKFPQFNVVASAGGADEPPAQAETLAGLKTTFVELGPKGLYAMVLALYDDPKQPIRYQRVPLDARFGESERMKQVLASYQDQLKEMGWAELGIKETPHVSGRTFVGSQVCGECHSKAYAVWKKTPHAHALETLVNLDPPRQFDAECLSCHVTGWEPQKFYPFTGGYLSLEKTPALGGNGCENCHGPGSKHVAAEQGELKATAAELESLRKDMRLSLATDADRKRVINKCLECHDADNSIEFKSGEAFDLYWPKVQHHGKD